MTIILYHEITHILLIELEFCFFEALCGEFGYSETQSVNFEFFNKVFDNCNFVIAYENECLRYLVDPLSNLFQHILLVKFLDEMKLNTPNDIFLRELRIHFEEQKEYQKNTLQEFLFVITGLQLNLFSEELDNTVYFQSKYSFLNSEFQRIFKFNEKICDMLDTDDFRKIYKEKVDEFCYILLESDLLKRKVLSASKRKSV